MKLRFRYLIIVVTVLLLLSVTLNALAINEEQIEKTIRTTYATAYELGKKQEPLCNGKFVDKDGTTYCSLCAGELLVAAGAIPKYLHGNGNKAYQNYSKSATSNGYKRYNYPGKNKNGNYTIKQICQLINEKNKNGEFTYVIFGFNTGYSAAGKKAGHAVTVHCIYNGIVYYSEYNEPYCKKTINEFANRFREQIGTDEQGGKFTRYIFDGAVMFTKMTDYQSISTVDEYYTARGISLDPTAAGNGYKKDEGYTGNSQITLYSAPITSASTSQESVYNLFHVVELVKNKNNEEWYKLDNEKFIQKDKLTYQYKVTSRIKYWCTALIDTQWGRAPFDADKKGITINKGDQLKIAMTVENKYGNTWYQFDSENSGKWGYYDHFGNKTEIINFGFKDVVYPQTFRINTSKGWNVSGGTIYSDNGFTSISTKIVDSKGKTISPEKTFKNIPGTSYSVKQLNSSVKFSKITKAGTYCWIIKAIDGAGHPLILEMPITAKKSGSTKTAKTSKAFNENNDPTPAPTTPAPTTPTPTTPAPTTPAPTTPAPTTPAPTTPAPTTPAPTTPVPSSDNLEFQDVVYPSTFRINTSAGWNLVGGTVNSSKGLSSISTKIISVTGTVISKETTRSISGNTYNVKSLDTFEAGDNGVKFSRITTAGHYIWVLTITDTAGRTLTMQMPVNAVTSGSTATQTMSKKYGEQEETVKLAFNDVVYPRIFRINTSAGWKLSGGTATSGSGLALISTKIVDSSGSVISKETTRNISGYSYNIKSLDTFEAGDNGVKFSKIKKQGSYKWILTVTDVLGRQLTLEMKIIALPGASTDTRTTTASKQYGSKNSDPGVDLELQEEDTKMTVTVDGLKYVVDKATLTATFIGMKDSSATSIVIPSTMEKKGRTYKVTKIEKNACKNATSLTKITIGKNVEEIGKKAFSGCKNLEKE